MLFCQLNNLNLDLVDNEHTACNTALYNDIINNKDNNIKVIFSGPAYLDWYGEWETNIIVQELTWQKFLKFHCPVCGHEN